MAIVDEGSGETSALLALHESNNLIMTLLQRLRRAAREAAALTMANDEKRLGGADGEGPAGLYDAVAGDDVEPQAGGIRDVAGGIPANTQGMTGCEHGEVQSGGAERVIPPMALRLEAVDHLHPCFAEGVLYSNAKGVFIPDTKSKSDADQDRAALIIQSSARQAKARRKVAEKKSDRLARTQGSKAGEARVKAETANRTDQERAAMKIQGQAQTEDKGEDRGRE